MSQETFAISLVCNVIALASIESAGDERLESSWMSPPQTQSMPQHVTDCPVEELFELGVVTWTGHAVSER